MAASAGAIRAGSAYVEIFARDGQFQQGMSRIRARLMTLGTQLRQAGTSMTLGGAAIGAPFIFAARTAAAFSLEMARVKAVAEANDVQFAALNTRAKELAIEFGKSPAEVAAGMGELAKAGQKAEGVMKSITPILAVAAGDNLDLARAVEVVVSAMQQFGMGTDDFGQIADKLRTTSDSSTASVDSLGEALTYIGPKAMRAGQDLDTILGSLAVLSDAGLRGSLGGTGLSRIIESIANEEEKLAALGVSTRDQNKNMLPFMDIMEQLGKKAPTANIDSIRVMTDIFEIRGANAAISLSNMRQKYDEVMQAIGKSGGTAVAKAKAVMESFGGAVAQLGAQFGVFQIQVIESMGPLATEAVQAFTRMLAVVGQFISENGTLVTVVAGSAAALFSLGIASMTAGIGIQGLATGLRAIQAVLPLIAALFSPIGLAIAAVAAAIVGGVMVARTMSPAFKEETDATAAALMRLDFGAAWSVMKINLSIALVQMHQAFAQAFDAVKNTVLAASSYIGDKLIEGLDRFMGLFGVDILRLQEGFQKLGIYFRAAFDWDFAVNGMKSALKKVEDQIDEARQRGPTADSRADQRKQQREKDAKSRDDENKRRDAAFASTIEKLRKDGDRARERAFGKREKPAESKVDEKGKPIKPSVPAAPPGAFMPMEQEAPKPKRLLLDEMPEKKPAAEDKGISSAGNWTGVGLEIGPELSKIEDPALRTADATEQTAEAIRQLVAKGEVVSDLNDGQRADLVKRASSLKSDIVGLAMSNAGDAQSQLQAKVAELADVQKDLTALDVFRGFKNADQQAIASAAADSNMSAADLLEKIALGEFSKKNQQGQMVSPPAVALDVVAPRAPDVQGNANQGMQTAINASQTGVDFRQVGSEIVAAINAGTEVSKSMLGVLNRIAEKSAPEFAFQ
jgi:TP901 family phage tail tape measure protein